MRLPSEMLQNIFSHLYGSDVFRCRRVCRDWCAAVDSLPDATWREICLRENYSGDYKAAHKKYGLSWQETYRALNSWADIASAEMTMQTLPADVKVQRVKVLPNEIVACFQCRKKAPKGHSDTIVYYDLKILEECEKDEFDFTFSSYHSDINKHFIVLLVDKKKICIVIRSNKKQFFVGEISEIDNFTILNKKVYFKDKKDNIIYASKLIKKQGEHTLKTKPLDAFKRNHDSFEEGILAYSFKNDELNILTEEGNIYVYEEENEDFGWVGDTRGDVPSAFEYYDEHGFDWKSPPVSEWVVQPKLRHFKQPRALYIHARFGTGLIILNKTSPTNKMKIYNSKYIISGLWNLTDVLKGKPLRTITFAEPITQLDIVETATSHKILAVSGGNLSICEFLYK